MVFVADEYLTSEPPAFVWKARMQMLPFVSIVGRDRYAGEGWSAQQALIASQAVLLELLRVPRV